VPYQGFKGTTEKTEKNGKTEKQKRKKRAGVDSNTLFYETKKNKLVYFILLPSPFGEGLGVRLFHSSLFTLHFSLYSPRPLERGWG
jgi:hypothetical protein